MSWGAIEAKQGEDISHYVHSFGSRDSATKLKPNSWASPVTIKAVVRSQPVTITPMPAGLLESEVILILTDTSMSIRDRFTWNSKYYEALDVSEVWFKGTLQYYKATCIRVLEWSPVS